MLLRESGVKIGKRQERLDSICAFDKWNHRKKLGEIAFHIQAIGRSGGGKTVENRTGLCPLCGIAEQPLLSTDGERANSVLDSLLNHKNNESYTHQ